MTSVLKTATIGVTSMSGPQFPVKGPRPRRTVGGVLVDFFAPIGVWFLRVIDLSLHPAATEDEIKKLIDDIEHPSMNQMVSSLKDYLKEQHFFYRADYIDYPVHARSFIARKFGDCDDHASFITYCLEENGAWDECCMLTAHKDGKPVHSTCMFIGDDGKLYRADNWPGTYGPYNTVDDLLDEMTPGWSHAKLRTSGCWYISTVKNSSEGVK